jgi:hypothetical protein
MLCKKTKETQLGHSLNVAGKPEGRKETAMRVLKSTIIAMLLTATEALAYGGGTSGEGPSFLMVLFMGFGAVVIVFQIFPAVMLFCGMAKGLMLAAKSTQEATATTTDSRS